MRFTSNKVIELGSAAFRQWRSTHSHCQYIHGYNLTANITFECRELDDKNWVMDFGGLKDLKATLRNTFDHKLVVAGDDPEIETLKQLDSAGLAQVVILHSGVGCERFAQYVLKTSDTYVDEATGGRVRVYSVQINEHDKNFATCYRRSSLDDELTFTINSNDVTVPPINIVDQQDMSVNDQPVQEQEQAAPQKQGAAINTNQNKSSGMSNPFAGTSWG